MEQYWCVISRYYELNIINGIVHKFDKRERVKYLRKGCEKFDWTNKISNFNA